LFDIDLDIPIAIRNGTRTSTQHSLYPLANFISYHRLGPANKAFTTNFSQESIPNTIKEAMLDPKWKEAALEEMRALQQNDTWEVVDLCNIPIL